MKWINHFKADYIYFGVVGFFITPSLLTMHAICVSMIYSLILR